jgi:hypothetical protein
LAQISVAFTAEIQEKHVSLGDNLALHFFTKHANRISAVGQGEIGRREREIALSDDQTLFSVF